MNHAATGAGRTELSQQVLRVVHQKKICDTETLLKACASYPWNEVFIEIDQLCQCGELCVCYKKDRDYAVKIPPAV